MNFEAVIGLEIHVETKTESKMFSSAPNRSLEEPNTLVAPLDMAFPGTMPRLNKRSVEFAIRVAHALHMEIDDLVRFDRKNYFYSDLPKGFQITQQFHPIGKNGYIQLGEGEPLVHIERIHMEEDTCKQLHFSDFTLLDYNRAGVPLLEIVSCPEMHNGKQARLYVEGIRNIVIYSLVSDGKMEEGSLRCDVNISLRPIGFEGFGTKVEIKNLNSLKNIEEAVDYEIKRQSAILYSGGEVIQETRRYDESSGKTVLMRVKTDAVDYKYFPEPNLVPVKLSPEFIKKAIEDTPELYDSKLSRYIYNGLSENEAKAILSDLNLCRYYEGMLIEGLSYKEAANYLLGEILQYLNKNRLDISKMPIKPKEVGEILIYVLKEKLNHKQGGSLLLECLESGISKEAAKKKLRLVALEDNEEAALALVREVLKNNPQSAIDFKNGKDRALGYLIGQAMKASKGRYNPALLSDLFKKEMA